MNETENDINIVYGEPINEQYQQLSLGKLLLDRMEMNSNLVGLIDGITDEQMTWGQIRSDSIDLANSLNKIGLVKGDCIGICSENRVEFCSIFVAAFNLGIIVAPMNFMYTERELHHAINLSKPTLIFVSPIVVEKVFKVGQQCKFVDHVIQLGHENPLNKNIMLFNQFVKENTIPGQDLKITSVNSKEDVSLIMLSSGTTGQPKGVQLTYLNVLTAIREYKFRIDLYKRNNQHINILGNLPWFHVYGTMTLVCLTGTIAKIIYLPKFEPVTFLRCIQDYKVSVLNLVPPIMIFLAKNPLVSNYDLSSLRHILCGAAPITIELINAVKARIGIKYIWQVYGMSETTLGLVSQFGDYKFGSVGILSNGSQGKVIDLKTGKSLGPHQPGELCFKSPLVMKGYVSDDAATLHVIDKDGWLHTGDIGYYDEDKYWYIVDRLKEIIKYKAFQVPPAELESILLTHVNVKDAACIGVPDEECGELPMAFVVKQSNTKITEDEIIKYVNDQVSSAKRLRGGVRFVDEIPKNPSGKILRRVLRVMLQKQKSKL